MDAPTGLEPVFPDSKSGFLPLEDRATFGSGGLELNQQSLGYEPKFSPRVPAYLEDSERIELSTLLRRQSLASFLSTIDVLSISGAE